MLELLNEYERLEKIMDEINKAWDEDPMNEEIEKQWDEASKAEWNAMFKLLTELEKIGIDKSTGRLMLATKREKLRKLFAMA